MVTLVGVSGLCGSGKSTGVEFLSVFCPGDVVYLGGLLLQELIKRQLNQTPENELRIQNELRAKHGDAALAALACPIVAGHFNEGRSVIVDAIFSPDELNYFRSQFPRIRSVTLAIHASRHIRCGRLLVRKVRPLTSEQVLARDANEVLKLGASRAIVLAEHHIVNNGDLDSFKNNLMSFWDLVKG
jgi:dephospho-CoA kinase